ncbi:hypothetical protein IWX88_000377 [Frigoribacterium sp. CG_9.8]|nr:hypothetical protein [Frigoribacterium sp. CG_9.8]MBG6106759.1 hypothetical protein [Frigoribacterium sp. CG_9.8]
MATPTTKTSPSRNGLIGTTFVHTVIDDRSRVTYAEIHDDEAAARAVGVLLGASWFAAGGVIVQ